MPSPIVDVLAALDAALRSIRVRWYLFGAQAAILHGAARLTADIDVTIDLGEQSVPDLVGALQTNGFAPRVDDPEGFAARTRVLPVAYGGSNMAVDLVFAGTGLEETFFTRCVRKTIDGLSVNVASAEDLLIMKILAGREKDLDDALAITAAQTASLDLDYVRATLRELEGALDRNDLSPVLERILRRVHR